MKQEYVEGQVSLLGRVAEFWRLVSVQAGVGMERWKPVSWSDKYGVEFNSTDPETSYYITKELGGYRLQVRSRAEVRPTALCGKYEDVVKLISVNLGSEFRWSFRWPNLYDIWGDEVPVGIVISDRGNDLVRYSLGVDPSRFVETARNVWARGPQASRLLLLTIDELHQIILTPPPSVDE